MPQPPSRPSSDASAQTELGAGARVVVGRIAAAHGIKGQVKVQSFTADPADLFAYRPLTTADGRELALQPVGMAKEGFLARLAGVADRDAAERLVGTLLHVARAQLPAADDAEEFYHADLIGLAVEDLAGAPLGRVQAVWNHGAGDILEIVGGPRPLLIPFSRAAVPTVDLVAGRIVVDPPAEIVVQSESAIAALAAGEAAPAAANDSADERTGAER